MFCFNCFSFIGFVWFDVVLCFGNEVIVIIINMSSDCDNVMKIFFMIIGFFFGVCLLSF